MSTGSLDTVESLMGRRLRPWWGKAPSSLIVGGVVGLVIMGFVIYGCLQVRTGEVDLSDAGLAEQSDLINTAALVVMGLAALGVLYNALRVVVGVIDMVTRRTIEGVVVDVRRRHAGDVLPWWLQQGWRIFRRWRNRNDFYYDDEPGRVRYELTVDTGRGSRTLPIRPGMVGDLNNGTRVRVTVTNLTAYVSRVTPL